MIRFYFTTLLAIGLTSFESENQNSQGKTVSREKQTETNDSLILWSSTRKLTWDDFQGKIDSTNKYKALTYIQIGLKSEQYDDSICIDVPTYFYTTLSWSKSLNNPKLLKHEQLHFDLAELMARKIRKEYSSYVFVDIKKGFDDLKGIYRKYYGIELDQYNRAYDKETEHGTIVAKQKEWELKIATELKALNVYSSTRVVIKRLRN